MSAAPRTRCDDPLDFPDDVLLPHGSVPSHTPPVGRVNTPSAVARWMVRESLAVLPKPRGRTLTIVEPAAGSGVIVAALAEALSRSGVSTGGLHAIDSDLDIRPAAIARMRMVLGAKPAKQLESRYRIGDALLDESLMPRGPIDLIIGNPPFLGARDARRLESFKAWQSRFAFRGDLYAYFMLWAMERVREGGIVCLLTPDTWLQLSGYQHVREAVLAGRLLKLVRLPANTFHRRVFPCFFVWQKTKARGNKTEYVDARDRRIADRGFDAESCRPVRIAQSAFGSAPRAIIYEPTRENRQLAALLAAVEKRSLPRLGDFLRTIDTGIHSRNCRHKLFFAKRSGPGLKRLLQGRQIEPFAVRWDSPKARYRWVDISYEPKPGVRGRRGDGSPSVRDEYWDWQGDPAIHTLPQRILIRQTSDRIVAARCIQGRTHHYTDNTLFTALPTPTAREADIDERFLVAYLNSDIASRFYRFLSGESGRPQAQIKITLIRDLPFVVPSRRILRSIERLVERIEAVARRGESTAASRSRLDAHFARLFDFDEAGMLAD